MAFLKSMTQTGLPDRYNQVIGLGMYGLRFMLP